MYYMSSHLRDNKQNEKQLITGIICSIFIFINFFFIYDFIMYPYLIITFDL